MEVAGNGYINIRLDRAAYALSLFARRGKDRGDRTKRLSSSTPTSIRTKPRISAICAIPTLGDTFVRMLRSRGQRVEVQNYIDNTGVQVADVVVGFQLS